MNESVPHTQAVRSVTICLAVFVAGAVMNAVGPATVWAQSNPDRATVPTQEFVDQLIKRLSSDKLADREDAARQLATSGPAIIPLLPADRDIPDAQTRSTLRLIRQLLWKQKAVESIEASVISTSEGRTVGQFIESLKESGNSFEVDLSKSALDQLLTLPGKTEPKRSFWEAVSLLEQHAPVALQIGGNRPSLRLVTTNARRSVLHSTGPFRIEVTSVGVRDVIGREDVQLIRIEFSLMTEPRLRPLFLSRNGQSLAVTYEGRTAKPFSPSASIELPLGQRGVHVEFHSDFLIPKGRAPKKIDVQGEWRMQLSGGREPFRFELSEAAAGARRRRAGVTVGLEQVARGSDKRGQTVDVVMSISYRESGRAFESHRNWLGKNDIRLEDKASGTVSAERMDIELQVDGSAWVRYRFRPQELQPVAVVYVAPTLISETVIPVRFKGLTIGVGSSDGAGL